MILGQDLAGSPSPLLPLVQGVGAGLENPSWELAAWALELVCISLAV